jgi:hypothetical protein
MTETESFQRGVFPYTRNGMNAYGDPLKIREKLHKLAPDFPKLVETFWQEPVKGENEEAVELRATNGIDAAIKLEPAILAAFGLSPLAEDGSGVSLSEAMIVLGQFLGWESRAIQARIEAETPPPAPEVEPRPEPEVKPVTEASRAPRGPRKHKPHPAA